MLPAGIATGETFDRVLIRERAVLMAEEFRANGVPITLRAAFGKATVRTFTWLQLAPTRRSLVLVRLGSIITIKHWICNEQETMRNPTISDSGGVTDGEIYQHAFGSNIDDRTMHGIYIWPFAEGNRARVTAKLCARISGSMKLNRLRTPSPPTVYSRES
ncbi:hypothetical protein ABHI18_008241 [Aspergillus niger]